MKHSDIEMRLAELDNLQEKHLMLGEEMLKAYGGKLYSLDFLAIAVLNRSMSLISGFISLIRGNNFISAAPLLRVQLDSALRFYAAFIVESPHAFAESVIRGKSIRDMKDKDGNKMTDRYLVEKLSDEYPWIRSVYNETSGYIHLSEKHIYETMTSIAKKNRTIDIKFGASQEHIPEICYIEAINAFKAATDIILRYVGEWAYTKNNPDEVERRKSKLHGKQ